MECDNLAIKAEDTDNVATVFSLKANEGSKVEIHDRKGFSGKIILLQDIPYGHKVSLKDINSGEDIVKYGHVIGAANKKIRKGEYVHVHNMSALRGRGDLY